MAKQRLEQKQYQNLSPQQIQFLGLLQIPIVAILDSNSDPTGINFPIPGNDDARRSIDLYCELLKQTILDGKKFIAKKQINGKDVKNLNQIEKIEKKDKTKEKSKNPPKKKDTK